MSEILMAEFDTNGVDVAFVSESNSVTYKIELGGATDHSVAPYIKKNGINIADSQANNLGLNLREFNSPSDNGTEKNFILNDTNTSINSGFVNYINNSSAKLIAIFSGRNLKSSPIVDDAFKSWKSLNWPGSFLCNNYSCGYVAFYSPAFKRIVSEVMISSDGNEKNLAILTSVYDDLDDIGILGIPDKVVNDSNEYSTLTGYEYKRYPSDSTTNLMSDYGLIVGKPILISADLYQTQNMLNVGMKTRLNLRWLNGSTIVANESIDSNDVGWSQVTMYSTPPNTANGFTIVVSRYPKNDVLSSKSAIKNVCVVQVSKNGSEIKTSGAVLGVNGIRVGKYVEKDKTDSNLMQLKLNKTVLENIVPVVNLKEI